MDGHNYPEAFGRLVRHLRGLPGVGARSAERMVFELLKWPEAELRQFGESLSRLRQDLGDCPECGNISERGGRCAVCAAPGRQRRLVCVVENAAQIAVIERGALYRGAYHVLGGRLSPLSGVGPEQLRIDELVARVESGGVDELVMALSQDVEGQATVSYLVEALRGKGARISRLARGLPAGSDISYADAATIAAAFSGRVAEED